MKFTFFQIAIIALQQTIKVAAAAAADFTTIGGDFENVSSVNINMPCSGLRNIPKTMFTIQPSDSADVKTFPPNLVIASIDDAGSLSFTWNPEVASTVVMDLSMQSERKRRIMRVILLARTRREEFYREDWRRSCFNYVS